MHPVPPFPVEVLQMRLLPRVVGLPGGALLLDRRVRVRGSRGQPREGGTLFAGTGCFELAHKYSKSEVRSTL